MLRYGNSLHNVDSTMLWNLHISCGEHFSFFKFEVYINKLDAYIVRKLIFDEQLSKISYIGCIVMRNLSDLVDVGKRVVYNCWEDIVFGDRHCEQTSSLVWEVKK